MNSEKNVRTRFAPSPTGHFHMGGARTALFTYLFTKKQGGEFILRIEDTDQERFVEGAEPVFEEGLTWLGIPSDEGPSKGGDYGPYRQSERRELYLKYAKELLTRNAAYYCFCTSETLAEMREQQQQKKLPPRYDRRCRTIPQTEAGKRAQTEDHVVRLKLPEAGVLVIKDIVRGKVTFKYEDLDDQVLLKSDGYPTYHLASIIDDYEMEITHVIRSEEWLPSTPKHVFLLEALELPVPEFAHLPMVLNENRSKMSKRKDGERVWLQYYRDQGYLPEAVVNFLAFLGWNPKSTEEFFTLEELVTAFDLNTVHKAGAVFDVKKLNHINAHYIKELSREAYLEWARRFLAEKGMDANRDGTDEALLLEQERLEYFAQIGESTAFFFIDDLELDPGSLVWKKSTPEETLAGLKWVSELLEKDWGKDWAVDKLESRIIEEIQKIGKTNGEVLFPLRYALTGQKYSPTPFECLAILGQKRSLARIDSAISVLS